MALYPLDMAIVIVYILATIQIGVYFRKRATSKLDAYYLAERQTSWWMIGLSGCSSYTDIGGTMLIVGLMYYLGIKSMWVLHIGWGFFMMAIYMSYQAKYIRRSGVMTPAEWNVTRFGDNRDTDLLRLAVAGFVLLSMILTLMYVAVGTGKFAEEFVPLPRWASTSILFVAVGIYVTFGGFFGVVWTDILQTILIILGAIGLSIAALYLPDGLPALAARTPEWGSLMPTATLWPEYLNQAPATYHQYFAFGPFIMASIVWMFFKLLAGPLGWDFAFFLTTKDDREASLAAGAWTLGHTVRWLLAGSFLAFGIHYMGTNESFDAERIMPIVVHNLPLGISGLFMAVLLAALMSTLSAIINVTSNVVLNDFLKRYFAKNMPERSLIRLGMVASTAVMIFGFGLSFMYEQIVSAWELLLYVMLTMIMVPAALRWHWWRFNARAFLWSMAASTGVVIIHKAFLNDLPLYWAILFLMGASFLVTVVITLVTTPSDMETLVRFYAKVRPFGIWGPVRREAIRRGLVPAKDSEPTYDVVNSVIASFFQLCLGVIPLYMFLKEWSKVGLWVVLLLVTVAVLYKTWYMHLPPKDMESRMHASSPDPVAEEK
jgi:solute:Na+ symporter, SSS family